MRTLWGHSVITEKGVDYVLLKDYLEISKRITTSLDDLINIKEQIDKNDKLDRISKLILMTTYNMVIGTLEGSIAIKEENRKDE